MNMNKVIIAAIAFALIPTSGFAGGEDPSPEKAADPVAKKEQVLGTCLERIGFTWVPTVEEYEAVRYEKPNHFYFGSKIWISRGSDLSKARPCLDKVGAKS